MSVLRTTIEQLRSLQAEAQALSNDNELLESHVSKKQNVGATPCSSALSTYMQSESVQSPTLDCDVDYEAIFNQAPIPMLLTSVEGRILAANDNFTKWLGFTMQEFLSMSLFEVTHFSGLPTLYSTMHQLLSHDMQSVVGRGKHCFVSSTGDPYESVVDFTLIRDQSRVPRYFQLSVTKQPEDKDKFEPLLGSTIQKCTPSDFDKNKTKVVLTLLPPPVACNNSQKNDREKDTRHCNTSADTDISANSISSTNGLPQASTITRSSETTKIQPVAPVEGQGSIAQAQSPNSHELYATPAALLISERSVSPTMDISILKGDYNQFFRMNATENLDANGNDGVYSNCTFGHAYGDCTPNAIECGLFNHEDSHCSFSFSPHHSANSSFLSVPTAALPKTNQQSWSHTQVSLPNSNVQSASIDVSQMSQPNFLWGLPSSITNCYPPPIDSTTYPNPFRSHFFSQDVDTNQHPDLVACTNNLASPALQSNISNPPELQTSDLVEYGHFIDHSTRDKASINPRFSLPFHDDS